MDKNRSKKLALGNINEGDGYKFIGRGLKMTTGRYNYTQFNKIYKKAWPEEKIDFTEKPQLLEQPTYAARSGIVFWLDKKIYEIADQGSTSSVVDKVTKAINPYAPNKVERRGFFTKIKAILA